jgi:histidinol-phosphate aminotransferase
MKPYSSARAEGRTDAEFFLDANENPYPPYPGTDDLIGLNRYPEPQPGQLLDRFSELYGVPREKLFLSRGADEAIDLLVRAFCRADVDGILVTPPTFVMYETSARMQGVRVHEVPLNQDKNFALDVDGILASQYGHPTTKLVFICSPNNPTGNLMDRRGVIRLSRELLGRALVVVDELYLEYSRKPSLSIEIENHPNLVVLRSTSKEYSLAGERMGITIGHPEVIGILGRMMAPYPLAVSAIRAVEVAISPAGIEYGQRNIKRILDERERVRTRLKASPAVKKIFPSDANFLLVQVHGARELTKIMEDNGVKIRDRSRTIDDSVRISIGKPEENDAMLSVLDEYARRMPADS